MFAAIYIIIVGMLASFELFKGKSKGLDKVYNMILPFVGFMGIGLFVWGILDLLAIGNGLIWILFAALKISLGFLLGYGLIAKHLLSFNEKVSQTGTKIHAKLLPLQIILGVVAIIMGVWALIQF